MCRASPVRSGPVVSSLAGLSMLDDGSSSAGTRLLPAHCPQGWPNHPDYEVIRELGQGGMGTVYLAKNRLMGRHEVLKVVSSHLINRRGVLDRFLGEIRNAARLHHTNIVTAYSAIAHRREHRLRDGVRRGTRPGQAGQGQGTAAGFECLQLRASGGAWGCNMPTSTAWSTATSSRAI